MTTNLFNNCDVEIIIYKSCDGLILKVSNCIQVNAADEPFNGIKHVSYIPLLCITNLFYRKISLISTD